MTICDVCASREEVKYCVLPANVLELPAYRGTGCSLGADLCAVCRLTLVTMINEWLRRPKSQAELKGES